MLGHGHGRGRSARRPPASPRHPRPLRRTRGTEGRRGQEAKATEATTTSSTEVAAQGEVSGAPNEKTERAKVDNGGKKGETGKKE